MKKLSDYAYNVYSQFGEDGIIKKIFEILGTLSKVCIEFGAWDGCTHPSTQKLRGKYYAFPICNKQNLLKKLRSFFKKITKGQEKYDTLSE